MGCTKVHKTPRIPSILKIWASNVLTCCDRDFWPEAFYVWHSISYYAVNSHKNLPTNDSLKKVPVKLQVPENCILPGFFKILPPRRHSLGQRVRKGCGILSFSPSLYSVYLVLMVPNQWNLWTSHMLWE